ncbi:MAG: hypothetical protein ABJL99_09015 [Aliishimia sp.]
MKEFYIKIAVQLSSLNRLLRFSILGCFALLLAGCVEPPAPVASDQSFRVSAVSVRFVENGTRPIPLSLFQHPNDRFPPADIGLSKARVRADVNRALEGSLIPASRQGMRDVRAELVLYALQLRQGRSETVTVMSGWLDFYDTKSGTQVASSLISITPTQGLSVDEFRAARRVFSNPVREYDALIRILGQQLPKFLPRP